MACSQYKVSRCTIGTIIGMLVFCGSVAAHEVASIAHPRQVIEEEKACDVSSFFSSMKTTSVSDTSLKDAPEQSSGFRLGMKAVNAKAFMIVTANPYASQVGCRILARGGTAIDAALAVQWVLGLVEPQSSGIGGGGFLLYYDANTDKVTAYDGRETAPAAANADYLRFISKTQLESPLPSLRQSGRSIGTPGIVRMLSLAHRDYGNIAWRDTFVPAIEMAKKGFIVTPRFVSAIQANEEALKQDARARAYLFRNSQRLNVGERLVNPDYAASLELLANQGENGFYKGKLAQAIVATIHQDKSTTEPAFAITPGLTSLMDLEQYRAYKYEAVCLRYRGRFEVCGAPPPSSGGVAIAQALGILEEFNLSSQKPQSLIQDGVLVSPLAMHWMTQTLNLVFADRDQYLGDWGDGFNQGVDLPDVRQLIDPSYLKQRAGLISSHHSMAQAQAGVFGKQAMLGKSGDTSNGTTHVSVVDRYGNAVSFTSSVESAYGAFRMVGGFFLNNQLTDFSTSAPRSGQAIVNSIEANKRPRSSMAPSLVFSVSDKPEGKPSRHLKMVTGSPGGAAIIEYTLKSLIAVLDWELDPQQAAGLINVGARNGGQGGPPPVIIEKDYPNVRGADLPRFLADSLHQHFSLPNSSIMLRSLNSGISSIVVNDDLGYLSLQGGADPRREGLVLGE